MLQNVNGNLGGPGKQGGWSQGNIGNKQGGGNFGQLRGPRVDFNRGPGGTGQGSPGQGPVRNQQRTSNWAGPHDGKPLQREVIVICMLHVLQNK